MKAALVCGAGGFIGGHLVKRLLSEGYLVVGVDIKEHEFTRVSNQNYQFKLYDLREKQLVEKLFEHYGPFDEVYQLSALMGGCELIFVGEFDAAIMYDNLNINLNIVEACKKYKVKKVFFSSSACSYPLYNQLDPNDPKCSENTAYPADPDSDYGWIKLTNERLYQAYARNHGLNIRIARFHNIFGPEGSWSDRTAKAPAAICRKVAQIENGGEIELYGIKTNSGEIDGIQTRSFLYISECIDGVRKLMESEFTGPVNIGSDEMISIKDFANMIIDISGKRVKVKWVNGPTGVKGRNSDNKLIEEKLGWKPSAKLRDGIEQVYHWICSQIEQT